MDIWLLCSIILGAVFIFFSILSVVRARKKFVKLRDKYSQIKIESTFSTEDMLDYVEEIYYLDTALITLNITAHENNYDPGTMTLNLSSDVAGGDDVFSIACASHELGHAKDHQLGKNRVNLWYRFNMIEYFTSKLILPLYFIGLIFSFCGIWLTPLGTLMMNISTIFTICGVIGRFWSLPNESSASKNAIELLKTSQALTSKELHSVEKIFSVSKKTYICGFFEKMFAGVRRFFVTIKKLWRKKL